MRQSKLKWVIALVLISAVVALISTLRPPAPSLLDRATRIASTRDWPLGREEGSGDFKHV